METSLEKGQFRRGQGGRPSRAEAERRHRDLLNIARHLLLERGWEATSIDEISRQSGVAKRFIYARYIDKSALFIAAIQRYRVDQICALQMPDPLPTDAEDGLFLLGRHLLGVVLADESLKLFRFVTAEGHRLRELVQPLLAGTDKPLETITSILKTYMDRGVLEIEDLRLAVAHFFILTTGIPQRRAMLGARETPEEETQHLRAAIKLFLRGCRKDAA